MACHTREAGRIPKPQFSKKSDLVRVRARARASVRVRLRVRVRVRVLQEERPVDGDDAQVRRRLQLAEGIT